MTGPAAVPDPDQPQCGVVRDTGRFEWVCVLPPHATADQMTRPPFDDRGNTNPADRHYMRRRWPNSER